MQRIYLDPLSGAKLAIETPKRSLGKISGALACVHKGNSTITVLAEGPETALSIAQADPSLRVYATLGVSNMKHYASWAKEGTVILAMDNDGVEAASTKQVHKAAEYLSAHGLAVTLAMPDGVKQDFNDVLKNQGTSAVRAFLAQAKPYSSSLNKAVSALGTHLEQTSAALDSTATATIKSMDYRQALLYYVGLKDQFETLVDLKVIYSVSDSEKLKTCMEDIEQLKRHTRQVAQELAARGDINKSDTLSHSKASISSLGGYKQLKAHLSKHPADQQLVNVIAKEIQRDVKSLSTSDLKIDQEIAY